VATASRHLKAFADTFVTMSLFLARVTTPPLALLTSGVASADLWPQPWGRSRVHTCVPGPRMLGMGPFNFPGTFYFSSAAAHMKSDTQMERSDILGTILLLFCMKY